MPQLKSNITQKINPEEIHARQYKKRIWINIYLGLLGTTAWGIFETTILRLIGKIEKILPQTHNRFMKLMHSLFGSVVTPFESAFEKSETQRTFETRTPITKYKKDKIFLKKGEMVILPNEEVLQLLLRSNARTKISYCFCRMYAAEKGRPCPKKAPLSTCLTLSFPQPIDLLVQKEPREDLKKYEKIWYDLFKKCDDLGLVHQLIWIPSPNYTYVICNCCDCCCEVLATRNEIKKEIQYHKKQIKVINDQIGELAENMKNSGEKEQKKKLKKMQKKLKLHEKGAKMELSPIVARSAFFAIDANKCTNCGICVSRCYFDAREMHHKELHYDLESCYGCGLCVSKCPQSNIKLVRRPKTKLMGENNLNSNAKTTHKHPHKAINLK